MSERWTKVDSDTWRMRSQTVSTSAPPDGSTYSDTYGDTY